MCERLACEAVMAKVAEGTSVAELLCIMVDADRKALSAPKKLHGTLQLACRRVNV